VLWKFSAEPMASYFSVGEPSLTARWFVAGRCLAEFLQNGAEALPCSSTLTATDGGIQDVDSHTSTMDAAEEIDAELTLATANHGWCPEFHSVAAKIVKTSDSPRFSIGKWP
jgi:hypothetical protein